MSEFDAAYRAYDEHPLDEPDEWDDLASFRAAATGDVTVEQRRRGLLHDR